MATSDTGRALLSTRAAWALSLAATATMAVSYVDRQALAVLAPTITKQLRISETMFGWIGSAFSIAYLVCAPLAGRFIDRVGARRGLLASVLLWSAVAAAHALVPGLVALFVLRILLGVAEAPSFPAAAQTVQRALPPKSRDAGFGILFTGSSVGAAAAAVLAPWLEGRFGWRVALVGTAVVGLSWVPLWLLVTASAAAREVMAVRPEPESPRPASARWIDLIADRAVLRAVLAVIAAAPINGFVLQWGSKILVAAHHVEHTGVGAYLWLPPLLFDAGAVCFGLLASLGGRASAEGAPHRGLYAGAALLATALAALGLARTPWETTLLLGVALAGGGGMYALVTADMLRRVAPSRVAAAGGVTAAAQSLAILIAFPIIGAVVDRTHSYAPVGVGLGLWVLPGALAWLAWDPRPTLAQRAAL